MNVLEVNSENVRQDVKKNIIERRNFKVDQFEFTWREECKTFHFYKPLELFVTTDFLVGTRSIDFGEKAHFTVNNPLQVVTAAITGTPVQVRYGKDDDEISFMIDFSKNEIVFS